MINLDTIEQEILSLESRDTSWSVVEHLAMLYIVRDHLKAYSPDETTGDIVGNEFCEACSNVPMQGLMSILSEHMDSIALLYPREYSAIMQKIKEL